VECHTSADQVILYDLRTLDLAKGLPKPEVKLSFPSSTTMSQFTKGAFSPSGNVFAIGNYKQLATWDIRNVSSMPSTMSLEETDSAIVQVHFETSNSICLLQKKHLSMWHSGST